MQSQYETGKTELRRSGLIFIVLLFSHFAWGQQFYLDHYSRSDGLHSVSVSTLEKDNLGFLWIGSPDKGVSRFDGNEFELIPYFQHTGPVFDQLFDNGNKLMYFGTASGLVVYDGYKYKSITEFPVYHLSMFNNQLIFADDYRLYDLEKADSVNTIVDLSIAGSGINCIESYNDHVLIGTVDGLYSYKDNHVSKVDFSELPYENEEAITSILKSGENVILGTEQLGIFKLNSPDLKLVGKSKFKSNGPIQFACNFDDNSLLAGAKNGGLFIMDVETLELIYTIDKHEGLKTTNLNSVLNARDDLFWIGTDKGGLYKYSKRSSSFYNERTGFSGSYSHAYTLDDETVIIAHSNGNIDAIERGVVMQKILELPYSIRESLNVIEKDDHDRYWIGTSGNGIVMKDSTGYLFLKTTGGLAGNFIADIEIDENNYLWVATMSQGISRIDIKNKKSGLYSIKNFGKAEGLSHTRIKDMCLDENGDLWVASLDGVIYQINGDSAIQKSSNWEGFPDEIVNTIKFGEDNSLYFLAGHEFGRITNNKTEILYSGSNVAPHSMEEIGMDHWIIGGDYGVIQLKIGKNAKTEILPFNPESSLEGTTLLSNGIRKAENGDLYLLTDRGLLKCRSNYFSPSSKEITHHIVIEDIKINQRSILISTIADELNYGFSFPNNLSLPSKTDQIGFLFRAVDQSRKATYTYRWKLDGLDKIWSDWSKSNEILYSNLKAGKYRFNIEAKSDRGTTSYQSSYFIIEEDFWKKPWFISITFFGLFGAFVLLMILRFNRLNSRQKRQIKKLEEANKMILLEQKTRQLQMNPHFLNNALNSIQSLINTERKEEARKVLNDFALLMRQVLTHSKEDKVLLEDEVNLLEKYLSMERFMKSGKFDFNIHIDERLDEKLVKIPPMMIQPVVENAVQHGMKHLHKPGFIKIDFEFISRVKIRCIVSDNGRGLEYSKGRNKDRTKDSISLNVLEDRLRVMHNRPGKWLTIKELRDEDESANGVEVCLILPAS